MSASDHSQSSVVVIGVGNIFRNDDGAGILVARKLRQQIPTGVKIIEASGEGAALLDAWKDAKTVLLVDAVQSGAPAGTIYRFDARAAPIPIWYFRCSTHAFGVAEAVELSRALNQLPPCLTMFGIEGQNFSAGVELSVAVEHAIATVAGQMLDEIEVSIFQDPFGFRCGVLNR